MVLQSAIFQLVRADVLAFHLTDGVLSIGSIEKLQVKNERGDDSGFRTPKLIGIEQLLLEKYGFKNFQQIPLRTGIS